MESLNNFGTIFLSLIMEGFPFLLLGTFVSSLIQLFVSENAISKIVFKSKFLSLLVMSLAGLVFPVCECAIVPIVRRLMKKGMPVSMAVTFMTAVPIVNPVVFMSTYYAFLGQPLMPVIRILLGIICSIIIGILVDNLNNTYPVREKVNNECSCGHNHHHHEHEHEHNHEHHSNRNPLSEIIHHLCEEFYEIGRFFIIGALLSSILQTYVPRGYILTIGNGRVSSIIVMMVLAFVLSICSETDAFIARSFYSQFTSSSIIAFLIFGPMIDIKNTVMLAANFKITFVIKLIFVIVTICFIASAILSFLPLPI